MAAGAYAEGNDEPGFRLDIPASSIDESLAALARATKRSLIVPSKGLEGLRSNALSGVYTVPEALKELLSGTGLSVIETTDRVIAISASPSDSKLEREGDQMTERQTRKRRGLLKLLSGVSTAVFGATSVNAQGPSPEDDVDRIIVVGSAIGEVNVDSAARPVQVIDRKRFDITPAENISDLIRELPAATGVLTSPFNDESTAGRASINLRGVGQQYTLVLVEGRRLAGEDLPDINAIPPEAIEGVELLTGGASAIYGSDAVAGVVNFRLRKDIEGLEVFSSYGNARGGLENFRVGALFGVQGERGSFSGSVAYQDTTGLTKFDRDRTRTRDFRRFGGLDRRTTNFGVRNRITLSSTGEILTVNPDTVAPGQTPTSANDFRAFTPDDGASFNEIGILPPQTDINGHWNGEYTLFDDYAEFYTHGYVSNRSQTLVAEGSLGFPITVDAANPNNPFGEVVGVEYVTSTFASGGIENRGFGSEFDATTVQAVMGLRGEAFNLNYDLAYTVYNRRFDRNYFGDFNTAALNAAVASGDFNPFCNACNAEIIPSLTAGGLRAVRNNAKILDFVVGGELFDLGLGAAPVSFAVGYQNRDIEFSDTPDALLQSPTLGIYDDLVPGEGERTVNAVFGEFKVPLYDGGQAIVSSAEINGAVRHEDYSDFGGATVWQVSGRFGFLNDDIVLRASFAESFRAPPVEALSAAQVENFRVGGFFFDPVRNNTGPYNQITGGNPDLEPERGESLNIGVVFQPDAVDNLRVSIDYWDLVVNDRVRTPDIQGLFNGTEPAGGLTRDPVTLLPTVDARVGNGGKFTASGIDFAATYARSLDRWGDLSSFVNITRLLEFDEDNGLGPLEILRTWSLPFGPVPAWRLASGLIWEYEGFETALRVNYFSNFDDIVIAGDNVLIDRETDQYVTAALQLNYNFDEGPGLLEGLRVYGGIENLFDAEVPFVAESPDGWDRSLADLRGRYFYVGLRKAF